MRRFLLAMALMLSGLWVLPSCDQYVPDSLQADDASMGAGEAGTGKDRRREALAEAKMVSSRKFSSSLLDEIIARGEIRIAVTPGFLPFVASDRQALQMRDMVNSPLPDQPRDVVGFDIEIGRAIADSLGVTMTLIKRKGVSEVLKAVDRGEADIALSGLSRTLDRAKRFYFSDAYYTSGLVVLLPKSSGLRSLSAANASKELRVLVKPNTTSASFAERFLPNLSLIPAKDEETFARLLDKGGRIGVLDEIKARDFQARQTLRGTYRLLEKKRFTDEPFTIVMPRDETLRHYINYCLVDLKNSGKHEALIEQFSVWLEPQP